MNYLPLLDKNIPYLIERKRIKNIYYRYENGTLIIKAPFLIAESKILSLIKKHPLKILKLINLSNNITSIEIIPNSVISICKFDYKVEFSTHRVCKDNILYVRENSKIEDLMYLVNKIFLEYVKERTQLFYKNIYDDNNSPNIKSKYVKSYNGIYYKKKHTIILNTYLAFKDVDEIDYVIYHELAHIKYMDHSSNFHNFLDKIYPNNKEISHKLHKSNIVVIFK